MTKIQETITKQITNTKYQTTNNEQFLKTKSQTFVLKDYFCYLDFNIVYCL
jgi:hypothetical protein